MDCIDPGLVTPEDMLALADGEMDARTASHLGACAWCAREAAAYAHLDGLLRRRLFRVDCPSAQTLGELSLGLLDPQGALSVRAHLARCPHCSAELAALDAALAEDPLAALAPSPGPRARIIARPAPPARTGPALAAVRGAAAQTSRSYRADTVTVSLASESAASRWILRGMALDDAATARLAGAAVRLHRDGAPAGETTIDEFGAFLLNDVQDGVYELELALDDCAIVVEDITIGAPPA